MLTIKIKPNDEVTLKTKHPNKSFNSDIEWILCFSGLREVVELTDTYGKGYDITVKTRTGMSIRLPISMINKSYCLRRDHKRIPLQKKTLIFVNNG